MTDIQTVYLNDPARYRQLVWDYQLTAVEFFAILNGEIERGWFDQKWAVTRVLEHAPYYDAIRLVPMDLLAKSWPNVKDKIFNESIKKGYEFVLHRYALSTAR